MENFNYKKGNSEIVVAITGASGVIIGFRLLKALNDISHFVHLVISKPGFKVIKDEIGILKTLDSSGSVLDSAKAKSEIAERFALDKGGFSFLNETFLEAKIASGSATEVGGMAVVPCSMGSLSRIACGNSGNLIERAADVMLKERKKLIICPREMPFNDIHLKNMLSLSRSGAVIMPPIPGFYGKIETVDDIINFIIGKILDALKIDNDLYERWKGYETR